MIMIGRLLVAALLCLTPAEGFLPVVPAFGSLQQRQLQFQQQHPHQVSLFSTADESSSDPLDNVAAAESTAGAAAAADAADESDDEEEEEEDLGDMEKAWRYAKKPLLSIGSKGASLTHGNSLRQLLEQHTVVKVKVNTRQYENSLEQAFHSLKALAEENGAPPGIELLKIREADNIILFGWPGTRKRIEQHKFPPPPPPAWVKPTNEERNSGGIYKKPMRES